MLSVPELNDVVPLNVMHPNLGSDVVRYVGLPVYVIVLLLPDLSCQAVTGEVPVIVDVSAASSQSTQPPMERGLNAV